MAYAFASSSSQYLSASAALTSAPLTMACWFYNSDTAANRACVSVSNSGSTAFHSIILNATTRSVSCISNASGTVGSANNAGSNSYSLNTWNHLCGVVSSSTARSVFLNGTSVGSNATSATPAGINATAIGGRWAAGAIGQLMTGRLAEIGIWNVALEAAEIASLSQGVSCRLVRPQSLVFYAPLIRDLVDVRGGLTITNNGTATVAVHPRVYA